MPAVGTVTVVEVVPTLRLVYPETGDEKLLAVATSIKYPMAVDTEFQLAMNDVAAMERASLARGAAGSVSTPIGPELAELPEALLALTR